MSMRLLLITCRILISPFDGNQQIKAALGSFRSVQIILVRFFFRFNFLLSGMYMNDCPLNDFLASLSYYSTFISGFRLIN